MVYHYGKESACYDFYDIDLKTYSRILSSWTTICYHYTDIFFPLTLKTGLWLLEMPL